MMKKLNLFGIPMNKKTLVRWKIYIDRARMYLSYLNFVMIVFVFLNSINDAQIRSLLDEKKWIVYPVVMILFVGLSLLLGFLDTKLGLRKEELRNHATENPVTLEILDNLREIKENQVKYQN